MKHLISLSVSFVFLPVVEANLCVVGIKTCTPIVPQWHMDGCYYYSRPLALKCNAIMKAIMRYIFLISRCRETLLKFKHGFANLSLMN